jgi:hypothetical protein
MTFIKYKRLRRFFCRIGLHRYRYIQNRDFYGHRRGGRSMERKCICGKFQGWDMDYAQQSGLVVWVTSAKSYYEHLNNPFVVGRGYKL